MHQHALFITLAAASLAGSIPCLAAGLPEKQPNLIHVWRESVKPGRAAEHAKNEAGFVATFEKAKSTGYGLALISETGPDEAWYVTAWESNAAMGEDRKRLDKDAGAMAELTRLERVDAEYVNGVKKFIAVARHDLTVGQFPDLSKARFFEITTYRLRPGTESLFEAAAKAYGAAVKRAGVKSNARAYQVIAGLPVPTFLVFASVEDYGQFDQRASDWMTTLDSATSEEKDTMLKFVKEAVVEEETNRFRLDPVQSYVPKETRAKDPEFWSQK